MNRRGFFRWAGLGAASTAIAALPKVAAPAPEPEPKPEPKKCKTCDGTGYEFEAGNNRKALSAYLISYAPGDPVDLARYLPYRKCPECS